jgi:hypothetical protein
MDWVLVIPSPLLEIIWISLNDFDTRQYLCDIALGTVRIGSTRDHHPNFRTGILTFIREIFLGSFVSEKNAAFFVNNLCVNLSLLTTH